MRSITSKDSFVFYIFFSIAVVILIGVPLKRSLAGTNVDLSFDNADFTHPLTINNTYFPLHVGDIYVYSAETEDGIEEDTVTVTHQKRKLGGVDCRAVSDIVTLTNDVLDHKITEETTDWYAEDDEGNVWYCGEDSTEFSYDEQGNLVGSNDGGSWNVDVPGAEGGIIMLAAPERGDTYRQEFLEGVAEDMARVVKLDATVSIEYSDFDNCLQTKEWTPLESGSIGRKFYYPGLGQVYETELSGGKTVNSELVDYISGS